MLITITSVTLTTSIGGHPAPYTIGRGKPMRSGVEILWMVRLDYFTSRVAFRSLVLYLSPDVGSRFPSPLYVGFCSFRKRAQKCLNRRLIHIFALLSTDIQGVIHRTTGLGSHLHSVDCLSFGCHFLWGGERYFEITSRYSSSRIAFASRRKASSASILEAILSIPCITVV
jgi:hypothetical protein